MFAGSFRGRTQTMPLAIYAALETDLGAALALGTILVAVSVAVLGLVHWVSNRRERGATGAPDPLDVGPAATLGPAGAPAAQVAPRRAPVHAVADEAPDAAPDAAAALPPADARG
jgi:hypothetical protein